MLKLVRGMLIFELNLLMFKGEKLKFTIRGAALRTWIGLVAAKLKGSIHKKRLNIHSAFSYPNYFGEMGIHISLLKFGDETSLCSFHKILGPSACS